MMERERGAAALWGHGHLPLLARARSKNSVEYILQALWRTRRTGLDAADRAVARDILQLAEDADLDALLVCLRILIRRCVYENVPVPELFPEEVSPELQKLLTLLLLKFQPEWLEDVSKDQGTAPAPPSETADGQLNQNGDAPDQPAAATAETQNPVESAKRDVKKFPLAKDTLAKMLKDSFPAKDQTPNAGNSNGIEDRS